MKAGEYAILERGDMGWHTVVSFRAYGPDTVENEVRQYLAEASGFDGLPRYGNDFLVVSVLPDVEALAGVEIVEPVRVDESIINGVVAGVDFPASLGSRRAA